MLHRLKIGYTVSFLNSGTVKKFHALWVLPICREMRPSFPPSQRLQRNSLYNTCRWMASFPSNKSIGFKLNGINGNMWWWNELTITLTWKTPEGQYCTLTVHSVFFLHQKAAMMSALKMIMHDRAPEQVSTSHYPTCRWVALRTRCWNSIFIVCVMLYCSYMCVNNMLHTCKYVTIAQLMDGISDKVHLMKPLNIYDACS
jgi:hypothetical protein